MTHTVTGVHLPWCDGHDGEECYQGVDSLVLEATCNPDFPASVSVRRNLTYEDFAKVELETPDTSGLEGVLWLTGEEAHRIGSALIAAAALIKAADAIDSFREANEMHCCTKDRPGVDSVTDAGPGAQSQVNATCGAQPLEHAAPGSSTLNDRTTQSLGST